MLLRAGGNTTRMIIDSTGNIGINTVAPVQKLDVNGKIKLNDDATAPVAGTIRWNSTTNDFEGFNGSEWLSFTNTKRGTIGTGGELGQMTNYQTVTAPVPTAEDRFGDDIDISGEWAVVGSRQEGLGGAAHLYRLIGTQWQFFMTLTASDAAANDAFGSAVAIDGDYIVVGAPSDDNGTVTDLGSAYVFFFNGTTWVQQAKMFNSVGDPSDAYGNAVDIAGANIIVGAHTADDGGNSSEGKAFGYKRTGTTWSQVAVFTGSGNGASSLFGEDVAFEPDGNYLAIGAPGYNGHGAVYIFFFNGTTWSQQARLVSNTPANELFGIAVDIDNNTVVIGARSGTFAEGSAYVFFRSGTSWSQQAHITIEDSRNLGNDVAIQDDIILIGEWNSAKTTPCGDVINAGYGRTYVFKRMGNVSWEQYLMIEIPNGKPSDFFGSKVTIDDVNIGIVAPAADANGVVNSGKAIFGKLQ